MLAPAHPSCHGYSPAATVAAARAMSVGSEFIRDALHARDGGPKPETVITDTAS